MNNYNAYDDDFIREPDPAVIEISLAFQEVKEAVSYGYVSSETELNILTEFIFLTHIWAASNKYSPGIRNVLKTLPVFWIRLHAEALRRLFQFILSELIANPLVLPQGISIGLYCKEIKYQRGTTIIDGIRGRDPALIKNLVFQVT